MILAAFDAESALVSRRRPHDALERNGWGMGFGWLFMIFFWVVTIAVSVLIIRRLISYGEKKAQGTQPTESAFDMHPGLLKSQFEILEEPKKAIIVDIGQPPAATVSRIRQALGI